MNENHSTQRNGGTVHDSTTSYINPFDPDETAQISSRLANLVVGAYDLTDMPHELRVRRLQALITMYKAAIDLGEFEHTADWDWRIEIDANDTTIPNGETTMCDVLELPYEVQPNDYLDGFARWQNLNVEVYDWSDDGDSITNVPVSIDDIRTIRIDYM